MYQINVHSHPQQFGKSGAQSKEWTSYIKDNLQGIIIDTELKEIDFYNFEGRLQNLVGGSQTGERLIVFGFASKKSDANEQSTTRDITVDGETYKALHASQTGTAIVIDNVLVAEYIAQTNEINILIDLFGDINAKRKALLVQIFTEVQAKVFALKHARFSWKHTGDKPALMSSVSDTVRSAKERILREDEQKIGQYENEIEQFRRELKLTFDRLIQKRNQVENEKATLANIEKKIIAELDAIVENPKVVDLQIKNKKYTIHTAPIYAYDKRRNRYYIGNCIIEIDVATSDVKFFNDNPRKGFWSSGLNNHPHVNAEGRACLGNVSATIAELSAQQEIYALAMVCIDYLESVNIDDAAGKHVVKWDKVDEDGKVIAKGGTYNLDAGVPTIRCGGCESTIPTADMHEVYGDVEMHADADGHITYTPVDARMRCETCRDENYHYHDEAGVYVYE